MDWIERLNLAMDYIEAHLTEPIDPEALGRIALCSGYHFQRMFMYMAGMPLGEYVRRRRMSLAAAELQSGGKVIDTALRYGYQSPTAFTRAFQSLHGITPSQVQRGSVTVKTFPPLQFQITIKGVEPMDYRIEQKDAFRVLGVSCPLSPELEQNFAAAPALWGRCAQDGTIDKLSGRMGQAFPGLLGVSNCAGSGSNWRYYVCVATEAEDESLEALTIPAATWAVFSGKGRGDAVQALEKRIVTEWLPASGYEYAMMPDIEVYLAPDGEDMPFEVWIPVKKK